MDGGMRRYWDGQRGESEQKNEAMRLYMTN
jgi:hypothetical protein